MGGPKGLYACGECSGGMHGADRIGGLASAAALVFGRQAGRQAAREAACKPMMGNVTEPVLPSSLDAGLALSELRHAMSTHAMVSRTAHGLNTALATIDRLDAHLSGTSTLSDSLKQGILTMRAHHQLASARAMVQAMLQRKESCGSHHRADV